MSHFGQLAPPWLCTTAGKNSALATWSSRTGPYTLCFTKVYRPERIRGYHSASVWLFLFCRPVQPRKPFRFDDHTKLKIPEKASENIHSSTQVIVLLRSQQYRSPAQLHTIQFFSVLRTTPLFRFLTTPSLTTTTLTFFFYQYRKATDDRASLSITHLYDFRDQVRQMESPASHAKP